MTLKAHKIPKTIKLQTIHITNSNKICFICFLYLIKKDFIALIEIILTYK